MTRDRSQTARSTLPDMPAAVSADPLAARAWPAVQVWNRMHDQKNADWFATSDMEILMFRGRLEADGVAVPTEADVIAGLKILRGPCSRMRRTTRNGQQQ